MPPPPPVISTWPPNPTTNDDVLCEATDSIDPEGDVVSYTYVWVNGEEAIVSDTLDASWTEPNDVWTCSVHVFDSVGQSNTAEHAVGIVEVE